jgi:hypothetical protein
MGAAAGITAPGSAEAPEHGIRGSALLQALSVPLVGAVCLPLVLRIHDPAVAVLALAIVLVCTAGAAAACGSGARPMALLFWLFTGTWIGIGSLYQLAVDRVPWQDAALLHDTDRVLVAQALTLLALLAFAAGSCLPRRTRATATRRSRVLNVDRALLVAGACCLLGVVLFPAVAAAAGGLAGLFTTRASRTAVLAESGALQEDNAADGFLRILPASLALATAYIALTVVLHLRQRRREQGAGGWDPRLALALALAAAGVLLMVLYSNPLTSSRYISISGLGALAVLIARPRSRTAGTMLAVAAVIGLLLVYPAAYSLREEPQVTDLSTSRWDALATNDFDGFLQVVNTVQLVEEHGHAWGTHVAAAALFPVPRSLWTEKARPAALDVAENRGYGFIDLSLPLHAEFYLDVGLVGMVLLMVALGVVWARLDDAWLVGRFGPATLLVPYLCLTQLGLLRGPLGSLVPVAATTTVLLLIGLRGSGSARAAPETTPS